MPRSDWTADNYLGLSGRTIVVTGATSGLGLETTRALARAGARMVLAVRDTANGDAIAADIPRETEVRRLDVSDLTPVREFAQLWEEPQQC